MFMNTKRLYTIPKEINTKACLGIESVTLVRICLVGMNKALKRFKYVGDFLLFYPFFLFKVC